MSTIQYAAIGDSLTVGVGAASGCGFVEAYRELAEQRLGRPVQAIVCGQSGAKSGELAERLLSDNDWRHAVKHAQLITVTAGGNDLLDAAKPYYLTGETSHLVRAVKTMRTQYPRIIAHICGLKAKQKNWAAILVGLYNPLPWAEEAGIWVERFNRQIRRQQRGNIHFADVHSAFLHHEEDYISDDGFHPNAFGYRAIAEQVCRSGFGSIASG